MEKGFEREFFVVLYCMSHKFPVLLSGFLSHILNGCFIKLELRS